MRREAVKRRMKSIEVEGKSVEQAVEEALNKLGVSGEDVDIEVLENPNKGFLGIIGQKQALVRVTLKTDPLQIGKSFVTETCRYMGIDAEVKGYEEDEYLKFDIIAENPGLLIGRRGETLDSLQYLTNLVVNKKTAQRYKVVINTENYREKREETLKALADRLSEKVMKNRKSVVLEPMSPHERRIIHTALQDNAEVETFSQGEEPYRRVVIAPKDN